MSEGSIVRPRALLLDMDGTLTEPMLDFPLIKSEMGIGDRAILEALAEMSPHERSRAEAVLLRHEERAALESSLNPGCEQLFAWTRNHHVKTALITRNSRASVHVVLKRHNLALDVLIARDDCRFKPNPDPLLKACEALAVATRDAWMIGDGSHDIEAGLAAGITTVWISHGRSRPFAATPDSVVRDLLELCALLQRTTRQGV